MKVWMLILLSFSFSAFAAEFSHIKLNPEFEQYLTNNKSKSLVTKSQFLKSAVKQNDPYKAKMMGALMGAKLPEEAASILSAKANNPILFPVPVDGEESPLYEEIRQHLESAHTQIGLEQVQMINRFNQSFNLGSSNFSGFSWQKPFGVVSVFADRQVQPNIFGQNWLVVDSFTIDIEATTFLEKLAGEGLAIMSAAEIGAFAGITFRRVYTYWTYANSYNEGLTANFDTLFLPFLKFNQAGMERMGNEHYMKRDDIWTASAGGLITTPPLYNISFSAGALAEYDYQNTTTIQSFLNQDKRFKVGSLSKKSASAGVTASLQLDFFKLLQFTLLSFDLNYQYSSSKEFTLGFTNNQWSNVKADQDQVAEVKSLLRGNGTVKKLEPYTERLDESSSSAVEKRGSILIFGKMQKQKTEQIRVIKDNLVKVFYKNYAQNVKVVQDIFSRLFSAVVYKIFKLPIGASNAAIYSRQLTMEYEATHPQAVDPNIIRIDKSEQFSFTLNQYYNAYRTDRWLDKKFKNDLIWFVDNFTTLPKTYKNDIRSGLLKGPMMIESNLRVEKAGFDYLVQDSDNNVFGSIAKVCESKKTASWMDEHDRRELLEKNLSGDEKCVKDIGLLFLAFKQDYQGNFLKPSLAKFKSFVTKYYKEAGNIADLQVLFGADNTFINGRLQATTSMGNSFLTSFSAGQFRGLGVIDNFKRAEGSRVPASIVSE